MKVEITRAQELRLRRDVERAARWMDLARWWGAGVVLLVGMSGYLLFISHMENLPIARAIRGMIVLPIAILAVARPVASKFDDWVSDVHNRLTAPLVWATLLLTSAMLCIGCLDAEFLWSMTGDEADVAQQRLVFGVVGLLVVGFCAWAGWIFASGWRAARRLTGTIAPPPPHTIDPRAVVRRAAQQRVDRLGLFVEQLPWTIALFSGPFVFLIIGSPIYALFPFAAIVCLVGFRDTFENVGERLRSRDRTAAMWAARFALALMIFGLLEAAGSYVILRHEGDAAGARVFAIGPSLVAAAGLLLEMRCRRVVRDIDDLMDRPTGRFSVVTTDAAKPDATAPAPTVLPPRPRR